VSTEQRTLTPTPMLIAAGTLLQGDDHHYPEEAPMRAIDVGAFALDVHPVTNAQFARFVAATGHVAASEQNGLAVFIPCDRPVDLGQPSLWWRHDRDATWRCPRGTSALSDELADHPVVGVTAYDSAAYADWAGGRLPTEAEWEWAASGGVALATTWPLAADGMLLANVWLGEFPWRSIRAASPGTSPVGSFPPNPNGLFDMLGNVWELTSDPWSSRDLVESPCCDSPSPATVVAKGGSYLCAANYCKRYRPAARHRQPSGDATCHIGFRCAYDVGTGPQHG
jgi:formylglycine-generating enzyme